MGRHMGRRGSGRPDSAQWRRRVLPVAAFLASALIADVDRARAQKSLLDELIIIATQGTERGHTVHPTRRALRPSPHPTERQYHQRTPEEMLEPRQFETPERMQLEVHEVPLPGHHEQPLQRQGSPGGQGGMGALLTNDPTVRGVSDQMMVPPDAEPEGPPGGLTLDAAIARLLQANLELATKAFEIPIAEADALQAGLPKNPWFFGAIERVPYGNYRHGKPGDIGYSTTLAIPISLTGKYQAQEAAASQAAQVIRAQYQDAVRAEVDELFRRWVEVLRAREAVRFAQATVDHLDRMLEQARPEKSPEHVDALEVERELASYLVEKEKSREKAALGRLAEILNLPAEGADQLQVRDRLHLRVDLPPDDQLIALALCHRPDLVALRRDIVRAQLDVQVARARVLPDIWVLATPFSYLQHPLEDERDSVSWGGGALVTIPLIDRNQGNIRKARLGVGQTASEAATIERRVVTEVLLAAEEVRSTRQDLDRLEGTILPRVEQYREQARRQYLGGRIDDEAYAQHLQRSHMAASKYHQVLVRHREAMLRLNTALGCRYLP